MCISAWKLLLTKRTQQSCSYNGQSQSSNERNRLPVTLVHYPRNLLSKSVNQSRSNKSRSWWYGRSKLRYLRPPPISTLKKPRYHHNKIYCLQTQLMYLIKRLSHSLNHYCLSKLNHLSSKTSTVCARRCSHAKARFNRGQTASKSNKSQGST